MTVTAEQAVIGCILLDERAIRLAADVVSGNDFEDLRVGAIFDGILAMRRAGEHVDALTVAPKLTEWEIRGIDVVALHEWTSEVTSWAAVSSYADVVRSDSMRRGVQSVATFLQQGSGAANVADVIHEGGKRLKELVDEHAVRRLTAVPLGDVMTGPVEYDWVIPGLLERRDRVLVTGVEGGGKSTLMRQIAIASAAGVHPFEQRPMTPVRVLVIDAENSELQWRRASYRMLEVGRAQGAVDPAATVMLACSPRLDLSREQDLGQVHALVEKHRPDVLFLGPLYRLVPRAINSDDDAAPLLAAIDGIRELHDVALVMEAHAGHAQGFGGERDLRPRGSAALLGWPEFGFGLRPARDENGRPTETVSVVRWRGDRDARSWPDYLRRGQSWPWIPVEEVF